MEDSQTVIKNVKKNLRIMILKSIDEKGKESLLASRRNSTVIRDSGTGSFK